MNDSDEVLPTVARQAIQHLRSRPPGTELSSAELAEAIGQPTTGLSNYLMPSTKCGPLVRRMASGLAMWSLDSRSIPPAPQEPDDRSAVSVSARVAPSVFALGDMQAAAPFACSISTDGRMRIERHGRLVLVLSDKERRVVVQAASQGIKPV